MPPLMSRPPAEAHMRIVRNGAVRDRDRAAWSRCPRRWQRRPLAVTALCRRVSVPLFEIPPPPGGVLAVTVVRTRVSVPSFRIPPHPAAVPRVASAAEGEGARRRDAQDAEPWSAGVPLNDGGVCPPARDGQRAGNHREAIVTRGVVVTRRQRIGPAANRMVLASPFAFAALMAAIRHGTSPARHRKVSAWTESGSASASPRAAPRARLLNTGPPHQGGLLGRLGAGVSLAMGVHTGSSLRTIRSMGIARLIWRRLRESIGGTEERGLPVGRPARRVRSRGLPRHRRMEQKCGIMTEAIRQLLHGPWGW